MASKSLGPFPKTLRWHQIVSRSVAPARLPDTHQLADESLKQIIGAYAALTKDSGAVKAMSFLVALSTCSRGADPIGTLNTEFGIRLDGPPTCQVLLRAFDEYLLEAHPAKTAAQETIGEIAEDVAGLFEVDPWKVWRDLDGSAFCDLARLFFSHLNELYLEKALLSVAGSDCLEIVKKFAWETSLITRAFSARWFNACAKDLIPDEGSIQWYLGHCLGKLDLELSRELSDWVEPVGNPWKRKKRVDVALEI